MTTEESFGPYHRVTTAHGEMLAAPTDVVIGRSLCELGEYCAEEVALLTSLVTSGGVAIDVGAHIGAVTVPLARQAGAVLAVEPQPGIFQVLCANVVLNDLANVHTVNAACGATTGDAVIGRIALDTALNTGGLSLADLRHDDGVRIPVVRLDDLIDPPTIDLIKVDVEGMEADVLRGATALLDAHRPAVYVEVTGEQHALDVAAALAPLGYGLAMHRSPLFRTPNHAGRATSPWDRPMATMNMLALPPGREVPERWRDRVRRLRATA